MKRLSLLSSLAVLFLLALPAWGQSLWQDGASLYADQRPRRVGDIVTVVVNERTNTKDEAKTDVTKDNDHQVDDGTGILDFIRGFGTSSTSNMGADASTERTHRLQTQITCLVTEVLPSGNLVIEGVRDIRTNAETLKLHLRGVIRPQDVTPDNTIGSDNVANAELFVEGKGTLSRVQRPGLLTQLLQAIF
ncbi:MAG TPA: flagellar basal body L-ring protein FlgH [Thermosynergistes sp.]|nr:flagellar basal body L-ring protein FlgH [Thermosynergistes sp.]